jgi:hypothetical protein
MPMGISTGPAGGYGVRPANPDRRLIVTTGVRPVTKPPRLPVRPPRTVRVARRR